MAIDQREFRYTLSHFPSGVTVVTTLLDGKRYGMTVASFASLSLEPPLVIVCIEKTVATHNAIAEAGHFAVSILGVGQEAISNQFAMRGEEKFNDVEVREGIFGAPLIEGAVATIECRLQEALPGGDHTIFVGHVEATSSAEGDPLLYFRSTYHALRD
jgi:flavin reductase (DIM6/NTAB) family NADH-FMN oxidoreductase RutF